MAYSQPTGGIQNQGQQLYDQPPVENPELKKLTDELCNTRTQTLKLNYNLSLENRHVQKLGSNLIKLLILAFLVGSISSGVLFQVARHTGVSLPSAFSSNIAYGFSFPMMILPVLGLLGYFCGPKIVSAYRSFTVT